MNAGRVRGATTRCRGSRPLRAGAHVGRPGRARQHAGCGRRPALLLIGRRVGRSLRRRPRRWRSPPGKAPRPDASASYASKPASSQITVVARSTVRPGRSVSCAGASCADGCASRQKCRQKIGRNRSRASERRTRILSARDEVPANAHDLSESSSAPERIRTSDLRFRRPTLYPAELRAQGNGQSSHRALARVTSGEGGIRTRDGAFRPILA